MPRAAKYSSIAWADTARCVVRCSKQYRRRRSYNSGGSMSVTPTGAPVPAGGGAPGVRAWIAVRVVAGLVAEGVGTAKGTGATVGAAAATATGGDPRSGPWRGRAAASPLVAKADARPISFVRAITPPSPSHASCPRAAEPQTPTAALLRWRICRPGQSRSAPYLERLRRDGRCGRPGWRELRGRVRRERERLPQLSVFAASL